MDIADIIKTIIFAGLMLEGTRKTCELANKMDYNDMEEKRDELMEAVRCGVECVRLLMDAIIGESIRARLKEEARQFREAQKETEH